MSHEPASPPGPFDVLVLGSGVAGLSTALRLVVGAGRHRPPSVAVLTKGDLDQSTTRWAQGGVAAVLGGDEDSTDLHLADTLAAGAGLCDAAAVRILVDEGPHRVQELISLGVTFDREASGDLALAREGGHSRARVVHAGGLATGAEMERVLVDAARRSVDAVLEGWFALDLVIEAGRCTGVLAISPAGRRTVVQAQHVVLATGGAGQLFAVTTNPPEASGDGVAMALRAGAAVGDIEFVQFHPTALHHPAMPRPLLSEALRGHGAIVRDADGARFVDELAPRDVVSRAMASRMRAQGVDHLWLDATGLDHFADRFPTIARSLARVHLDPAEEWLPIAPAAHHLSGGVITDLAGATSVPGLWAAGEVACTGVHGANRLASNSLLEGMVFGARVAEAIDAGRDGARPTGAMDPAGIPWRPLDVGPAPGDRRPRGAVDPDGLAGGAVGGAPGGRLADVHKARAELQRAMTTGVGVVRDEGSLAEAHRVIVAVGGAVGPEPRSALDGAPGRGAEPEPRAGEDLVAQGELRNLVTVGAAMVRAARARTESRGAHTRGDHPDTDPTWRCRLVHGAPSGAPGPRP